MKLSSEDLYQQALNAFKEENYQDALEKATAASEAGMETEKLFLLLASSFRRLDRFEEALTWIEKVVNNNPTYCNPDLEAQDGNGLYVRAAIIGSLQRMEDALEAFDKVLSLDKRNPHPWDGKGNIFYHLRRFEEALHAYDQAILLNPKFAHAWSGKGIVLFVLKRFDEALDAFERAISLNPLSPHSWHGKGCVLEELHYEEEALNAFDQAININPNFILPWNGKGIIQLRRLRYPEANACFIKVFFGDRNIYRTESLGPHLELLENLEAPFWIQRLTHEFPNLLSLQSWQGLIKRAFSQAKEANYILDQLAASRLPEEQKNRLHGIINFYMGDVLESARIFEDLIQGNSASMVHYYYLLRSYEGFFEPTGEIEALVCQKAEDLEESSSVWPLYYAGLCFNWLFEYPTALQYFARCGDFLPAMYMRWYTARFLQNDLHFKLAELSEEADLQSGSQEEYRNIEKVLEQIESEHNPEHLLEQLYQVEKDFGQKGAPGYLQGFAEQPLDLEHLVQREVMEKYAHSLEIRPALLALFDYLNYEAPEHPLNTLLDSQIQSQQLQAREVYEYFAGRIKDLDRLEKHKLEEKVERLSQLDFIQDIENEHLRQTELKVRVISLINRQALQAHPQEDAHYTLLLYFYLRKQLPQEDFLLLSLYQYLREYGPSISGGEQLLTEGYKLLVETLFSLVPVPAAGAIMRRLAMKTLQLFEEWLKKKVFNKADQTPDFQQFESDFDEHVASLGKQMGEALYFSFE